MQRRSVLHEHEVRRTEFHDGVLVEIVLVSHWERASKRVVRMGKRSHLVLSASSLDIGIIYRLTGTPEIS